jgi:hypothetical protein
MIMICDFEISRQDKSDKGNVSVSDIGERQKLPWNTPLIFALIPGYSLEISGTTYLIRRVASQNGNRL